MPYNRCMQMQRCLHYRSRLKIITARVTFVCLLVFSSGCGSSVAVWTDGEVPFVRSTPEVIDRMLELARIKTGDVVYDIGSGDGAIVICGGEKIWGAGRRHRDR